VIGKVRRYSKMSKYGDTDIDVGCTRLWIDGCLNIGELASGNLQRAELKDLPFDFSAQTSAEFGANRTTITQESHTFRERRADQNVCAVAEIKRGTHRVARFDTHWDCLKPMLCNQIQSGASWLTIAPDHRYAAAFDIDRQARGIEYLPAENGDNTPLQETTPNIREIGDCDSLILEAQTDGF
jgi:hypothetical protein